MKVAIIGNRTFRNRDFFFQKMSKVKEEFNIDKIISGGAKGADTFGELFAVKNNIPIEIFYPDWDKYGKGAGFIRNSLIIENSDLIIAFWDESSNGTKDSIKKGEKNKKKIIIFNYENNEEKRLNF